MRLTIKLKLGLAFAAVIALSAAMAALGISSLTTLNSTMSEVLNGPIQRIQLEQELHADLLIAARAELRLIMADAPKDVEQSDQELLQSRPAVTAAIDRLAAIASIE